MILLNHTEHAIMLGDVLLIPAKPCTVPGTLKSLKDKYPALADYITDGAVESITNAVAQQALLDLEAKTLEELKAVRCKQQRRFSRKDYQRRHCRGN